MADLHAELVSTVLGASGSLASLLILPRCFGGACTSCFGCAGTGMVILLLALLSRLKAKNKEDGNGMA